MRKFNGKSNLAGSLIKETLDSQNITQEYLCQQLQLAGIGIDRVHLYRIIKGTVILKDFELIAICKILKIDFSQLEKLIQD